ncbi:MAG: CCA tRNA nucleotidyltransferase [Myxococcota bacterium]
MKTNFSAPINKKFQKARFIVEKLEKFGFESYIVGGAVRDMLLNQEPEDFDITTSAFPEDVEKIFTHTIPVGRTFGVMMVVVDKHPFEVATFRSDGKYIDGRRPEEVIFSTVKQDVKRRDFTVNSLLLNPETFEIKDFVGGRRDLQNKIIRAIGKAEKRFNEDKLRIIRALRFAARLGFEIEPETMAAVEKMHKSIITVSKERLRDEITRIITHENSYRGLMLLKSTGILKLLFPELARLEKVEQSKKYHPEGDVLSHTFLLFKKAAQPLSPVLAWAALLHDVGKYSTAKIRKGNHTFYRHEIEGANIAVKIMKKYCLAGTIIKEVESLIKDHLKLIHVKEMKDSTFKKLVNKNNHEKQPSRSYFHNLLTLFKLDSLASNGDLDNYVYACERLQNLKPGEENPPPLLNGHDLIKMGFKPGPKFGSVLNKIRNMQLNGALTKPQMAKEAAWKLMQNKDDHE